MSAPDLKRILTLRNKRHSFNFGKILSKRLAEEFHGAESQEILAEFYRYFNNLKYFRAHQYYYQQELKYTPGKRRNSWSQSAKNMKKLLLRLKTGIDGKGKNRAKQGKVIPLF